MSRTAGTFGPVFMSLGPCQSMLTLSYEVHPMSSEDIIIEVEWPLSWWLNAFYQGALRAMHMAACGLAESQVSENN